MLLRLSLRALPLFTPCSYAYHIVSNIPGVECDIRRPNVGLDAVDNFLDNLQDDLNSYIMPFIEKNADMKWDEEAQGRFLSETHWHICEKELDWPREVIARDHCTNHIS